MRAVAAELDVPVMTLYSYVASKDELGAFVVDHIFRTVEFPGPEVSSGFEPADATRAFAVPYTFVLGQVEIDAFFDAPDGPGEPTFEGISSDAGASLDELFEHGFDVVLAGLRAQLGSEARPPAVGGSQYANRQRRRTRAIA